MPFPRSRILVLGYLVRGPLGGLAWHHLQYVVGLCRLGHTVLFLEDSGDYPSCYDPARGVTDDDPSYGLAFADRAFSRLGMPDRWAYRDTRSARWLGPAAESVEREIAEADILINLSGVNPLRPLLSRVPHRVLVDTDPVFTQIRNLQDDTAREEAARHTAFFSFGENVRSERGSIPDDRFRWLPTRQPIVLDLWPVESPPSGRRRFTTVMQWSSYPAVEFAGVRYDMKSRSFLEYTELPGRTDAVLELALGSPDAPREELQSRGWVITDPLKVTLDPWTYQSYLRGSSAEFSVAKHGYVAARSGWFSERSAAYLASGRPVLAQETGFSDWLPTGSGVLPFSTFDEAVGALDALDSEYELHCRAAREIAAELFDSARVLNSLLERATGTLDPGVARINQAHSEALP